MTEATEATIDVAIIGGGPAGLTAALYAARGMATTVVFEQGAPGGQIATTDHVENYPGFPDGISGFDLGDLFAQQATAHGAEIRSFTAVDSLEKVEGGFALGVADEEILSRTVILATGSVPRKLGIPGEADYTGRGVSWCATCDAAFFREKRVAVIGGGNAAIEEAIFLTKFASEVHIIHRREEFRAAQVLVDRARRNDRITFHLNKVPLEITGDGDKVTGVVLGSTVEEPNEVLDIDGVFLFIGTNPTSGLVSDLLATDDSGYIPVGPSGETPVAGLFVAGDISATPLKQVVTAAGEGAKAGQAALLYLEELEDR